MRLRIKIQVPKPELNSLQNRAKKHSVKNVMDICHDANSITSTE